MQDKEPLRIFISHSHLDNEFGLRLIHDLRETMGDEDAVWYDVSGGLHGGDTWWRKIVFEISARYVFLVILSPDSMKSDWVNDEIDLAWKQKNSPNGKLIIPLLFRPCDIRQDLEMHQIISFLPNRSYEDALQELLRALGIDIFNSRKKDNTPSLPQQAAKSISPIKMQNMTTQAPKKDISPPSKAYTAPPPIGEKQSFGTRSSLARPFAIVAIALVLIAVSILLLRQPSTNGSTTNATNTLNNNRNATQTQQSVATLGAFQTQTGATLTATALAQYTTTIPGCPQNADNWSLSGQSTQNTIECLSNRVQLTSLGSCCHSPFVTFTGPQVHALDFTVSVSVTNLVNNACPIINYNASEDYAFSICGNGHWQVLEYLNQKSNNFLSKATTYTITMHVSHSQRSITVNGTVLDPPHVFNQPPKTIVPDADVALLLYLGDAGNGQKASFLNFTITPQKPA